jgi:hypothetical protein
MGCKRMEAAFIEHERLHSIPHNGTLGATRSNHFSDVKWSGPWLRRYVGRL